MEDGGDFFPAEVFQGDFHFVNGVMGIGDQA